MSNGVKMGFQRLMKEKKKKIVDARISQENRAPVRAQLCAIPSPHPTWYKEEAIELCAGTQFDMFNSTRMGLQS